MNAQRGTQNSKDGNTGRRVRVRQTRGLSGRDERTRATIQALGLGRVGKSRELVANQAVSGMIRRVSHLVEIEAAE